MKIVVLVKEVPDTYGDRKLDLATGLTDRSASEAVLDEIGERALEAALQFAGGHPGTEIVLLSMAPESAQASIRKGLAMGAGAALQVSDPALLGADLLLSAEVLAAALRRTGFDLVIAGNQSTDGSGGAIPAMLAELLDLPALTGLTEVSIADQVVSGSRAVDGGVQKVHADLPAIISITEQLPDPRLPNFKGIMAAKKLPFEVLSLSELGVDADDPDAARSIVVSVAERPPRTAGTKITDEGDAGRQLADFLAQNGLA